MADRNLDDCRPTPGNSRPLEPSREQTDEGIQLPPRHFLEMLLRMGPGMIIAAAVVGSGELILTPRTGAEAGFTLLWLIILGCVSKVFVQVELGRYAIQSGQTTLLAINRLPGPRFRVHWMLWYWVIMFVVSLAQLGGIAHGVGQALALAFPINGSFTRLLEAQEQWDAEAARVRQEVLDELRRTGHVEEKLPPHSEIEARVRQRLGRPRPNYGAGASWLTDDLLWAVVICLGSVPLLTCGRYRLIQWVCTILVAIFTLVTVFCVVALQFQPDWAITWRDLASGLSFQLPPGAHRWAALGTALATFGIIGMGTNELITYPYWCLEKGYARYTGRYDGSSAWVSRALGWMRVMRADAFLSMVIYTFATAAFYILGAAILHRANLIPSGAQMIAHLSEMYVPVFGSWTKLFFLTGAFAVLYSTFFSAMAGHSRVAADAVAIVVTGESGEQGPPQRWVTAFAIGFPVFALLTCLWYREPVGLIVASGFMQAIMLPMLAGTALYYRYRECSPALRPGFLWDICLWISATALLIAGVAGAWMGLRQLLAG
ncbi:MAG: Mn(2+) transporter [Thermogutta sp.]|nr:MAG: Mn(2+) transporter [Thermogutta sp.]